jgi:WD repeat-containing protein 92
MMERDKPLIIGHLEKSLNYSIFDTKWIPCSAKFLTIGSKPNGTGIIEIYELDASELTLVSTIEKKTSLKCGSFAASNLRDRNLAVGDFAGRLLVL